MGISSVKFAANSKKLVYEVYGLNQTPGEMWVAGLDPISPPSS